MPATTVIAARRLFESRRTPNRPTHRRRPRVPDVSPVVGDFLAASFHTDVEVVTIRRGFRIRPTSLASVRNRKKTGEAGFSRANMATPSGQQCP
jgi:hypothetical protein